MLLQGFLADTDSILYSQFCYIWGNIDNVNQNNLENKNATIAIYRNHFWGKETLIS